MAVCDPSLNAALPAWLSTIGNRLTAPMQQQASVYANDGSVPQNSIFKAWYGDAPVAFVVNCHTYTTNPDGSQTPGAFHGTSVWLITDPTQYPPRPSSGSVAASPGAALAAGVAFILALTAGGVYLVRRAS